MDLKETLKRSLWGQLGKPSGLGGRLIGRLMTSSNASAHDLTLSNAAIEANDRVLEIGFGGGALAEKVLASAPGVTVRGVDTSEVMVGMARDRLDGDIREGHADLRMGEVSSLPYADESFEKALSVHSIYFWRDPIAALEEICRVLIPGGRFVITVDPTEQMEDPVAKEMGYDRWCREALLAVLKCSGFRDTQSEAREELELVCAWGRKPQP